MQQPGLCRVGEYLRLLPLQHSRSAKTKKYDPNERTDQSSRKKQLSDEERANLSDTEFKTLVIRTVTELIELGRKMKEETKATQSEIKENIQGTNSEGKETGTQINGLDQKEETGIQKNGERLRNLWDNFKCSNIQIIGLPESEEDEQEIDDLFENIIRENFPNLAKEIDFMKSKKPRESQKNWTRGGTHQGTS